MAGLPVKEGLEALLAETLFSQLLCLPRPPLKPLAYSSIMVRAYRHEPATKQHVCPCWTLHGQHSYLA